MQTKLHCFVRLISHSVMIIFLFSCSSLAQQQAQPSSQDWMPGHMWGGPGRMHGPMMREQWHEYRHGWGDMPGHDRRWQMSVIRHHYVMQYGIPQKYYSKLNSLPATEDNLRTGAELYQMHCARCHGSEGYGDGAAGKDLQPPPSNLAVLMRMGMMARDEYLYWTIAEGGVDLETAMPAFKDTLTENDIWQLILYLRDLQANRPSQG